MSSGKRPLRRFVMSVLERSQKLVYTPYSKHIDGEAHAKYTRALLLYWPPCWLHPIIGPFTWSYRSSIYRVHWVQLCTQDIPYGMDGPSQINTAVFCRMSETLSLEGFRGIVVVMVIGYFLSKLKEMDLIMKSAPHPKDKGCAPSAHTHASHPPTQEIHPIWNQLL